jgi:hypothetical protein
MKRILIAAAAVAVSTVVVGLAQAPPKPGPEHQRLAAFVGNWTFSGEMKPGPMGPGGKMTGTDRISWLPGGFFIERRVTGKSPMGEMIGLEVMGYDSVKKTYTYNFFDNMGTMGGGTLTVTGSTWTATGTASSSGQVMQERCALTFGAGNTTLTVKCEMSMDGKTYAPFIEGTATKSK